jgi:hypothetical protein
VIAWFGALFWSFYAFRTRRALRHERDTDRSFNQQHTSKQPHRFGLLTFVTVSLFLLAGGITSLALLGHIFRLAEKSVTPALAAEKDLQVKMTPNPGDIAVVANGVGVIPGALVCANMNTLQMLSALYAQAWEVNLRAKLTHGQSSLIEGDPTSAPDPEEYGCELFSPGTPMLLEHGNVVPVVRALRPNGEIFRGVTIDQMTSPVR